MKYYYNSHEHQSNMKKTVLFVLGCMISMMVMAQKFTLTYKGFVDAENPQKDYLVINYDGLTKDQIYTKAQRAIAKAFVSGKDVMTNIPNEQISINGILPEVTVRKPMGMRLPFDMKFTMTLEFKDGKMRINAPHIMELRQEATLGDVFMYLTKAEAGSSFLKKNYALFKDDGKVNEKKHKENIELKTNELISQIISGMNEEDW